MVRFSDIVVTDSKTRKSRGPLKQGSLQEIIAFESISAEEIEDIYPDIDSLPPNPQNNDIRTYYKLLFERVKDIIKRVQNNQEIHPYLIISIFKHILDNDLLSDFQNYAASVSDDFAPVSHIVVVALTRLKKGLTLGHDTNDVLKAGFSGIIQSADPADLLDHIMTKESILMPEEIAAIKKKSSSTGGTLADLITEQAQMSQKEMANSEKNHPKTDLMAQKQEGHDPMEEKPGDQKALKEISKQTLTRPLKWMLWVVLPVLIGIWILWYFGLFSVEKKMPVQEKQATGFLEKKISRPIKKADDAPAMMPSTPGKKIPSNTDTTPETAKTLPPEKTPPPPRIDVPTTPQKYPYSLHVSSFQSTQKTEAAIEALTRKGVSAYRVKVDLGDKGKWFRIFAGYFPNADAAKAFKERHEINESRILKTEYAVLVGKFSSKDEQDALIHRLEAIGVFPYPVDHGNNRYQVLVGAFQTKKTAQEQAMTLKESGVDGEVILR